jgi:hypothetical protein
VGDGRVAAQSNGGRGRSLVGSSSYFKGCFTLVHYAKTSGEAVLEGREQGRLGRRECRAGWPVREDEESLRRLEKCEGERWEWQRVAVGQELARDDVAAVASDDDKECAVPCLVATLCCSQMSS